VSGLDDLPEAFTTGAAKATCRSKKGGPLCSLHVVLSLGLRHCIRGLLLGKCGGPAAWIFRRQGPRNFIRGGRSGFHSSSASPLNNDDVKPEELRVFLCRLVWQQKLAARFARCCQSRHGHMKAKRKRAR
jgi:hypothetical protein